MEPIRISPRPQSGWPIVDARLSPTGDMVAIAFEGHHRLWLWGLARDRRHRVVYARLREEIVGPRRLAFDPSGHYLVAGFESGWLRGWTTHDGHEVGRVAAHWLSAPDLAAVNGGVVSAASATVARWRLDGEGFERVWERDSASATDDRGGLRVVARVHVDPRQTVYAITTRSGWSVFELDTGAELGPLPPDAVFREFSGDGQLVLSQTSRGLVVVEPGLAPMTWEIAGARDGCFTANGSVMSLVPGRLTLWDANGHGEWSVSERSVSLPKTVHRIVDVWEETHGGIVGIVSSAKSLYAIDLNAGLSRRLSNCGHVVDHGPHGVLVMSRDRRALELWSRDAVAASIGGSTRPDYEPRGRGVPA